MKAKHLPVDILLDALAHLPPVEVDRRVRFVNASYRSLVERHGGIRLPKHTVSLHRGSPPPGVGGSSLAPLGWFSFGGSGDGEEHRVGVDKLGIMALLKNPRLGRVHIVIQGVIQEEYSQNPFNEFLKMLLECPGGVEMLRAACMVTHNLPRYCLSSLGGRLLLLPELCHTRYYIQHCTLSNMYEGADTLGFFTNSQRADAHLIWNITSTAADEEEVNPPLSLFMDSMVIRFKEGKRHIYFGGTLLILLRHSGGNAASDRYFVRYKATQPDEVRRRVDKWRGDSADFPACFRDYYRRVEGCEWRVWRVSCGAAAAGGGADVGGVNRGYGVGSKAGEYYLRVMVKVSGGGDPDVVRAVHFRMFHVESTVAGSEPDID